MRAATPSFALLILFACPAAEARAQSTPPPVPGDGVNTLAFQAGSPTARAGGVDVAVTQKATTGCTCFKIVIRVIDNTTGMTLATHTVNNPPENVTKSFTDLGANRQVQVAVTATFGVTDAVESKSITATVTTK